MRLTIDITAEDLKQIQKATGEKQRTSAIARALETYLREIRKRRLIRRALAGKTDYQSTNEELEARSHYDPR